MDQQIENAKAKTPAYAPPKLTVLGTASELTLGHGLPLGFPPGVFAHHTST
jgi:hypothetical protein